MRNRIKNQPRGISLFLLICRKYAVMNSRTAQSVCLMIFIEKHGYDIEKYQKRAPD